MFEISRFPNLKILRIRDFESWEIKRLRDWKILRL